MSLSPISLNDLPAPPPGKKGWPWTEAAPPLGDPPAGGWPPIGIVTPSFNQAAYIEATIRSVLLQGYSALEFFIEDGGSTDGSSDIIKRYEKFLSGWVSEKDRGQGHAINKGFARLREAQWINWINSDDLLMPGALEAVGRWAAEKPAAVAVVGPAYCNLQRKRRRELARPKSDLTAAKLRRWIEYAIAQPACFFSRAAFDKAGGVNEALHYAMDFELWIKLGEIGEFALIDRPLAEFLVHPDAKTQIQMGQALGETCEILFARGYAEEGRLLVQQVYDEALYLGKLVRPITDLAAYQKFVRPLLRRIAGPAHLKPKE